MVGRCLAMLGLAAAVGCYDPTVPIGLPCGAGCPAGQECQDGLCFPPGTRADGALAIDAMPPRPDAAPVDSDGDGVLDDDDNCADDPNVDQHDEDTDGRGDVCDFCPHLLDLPQDADGDFVGDACDPVTGVQHRIVFFDPFTSDRPQWTLQGPWVRANDMLSITATSDHATLDVPIGESLFELGGRITAIGAALNRQLTMTVSNDGATLSYYCEIYDPGIPHVNLTENDNGDYTALDTELLPNPLVTGPFKFAAAQSASMDVGACGLFYDDVKHTLSGTGTIVGATATNMNVRNLAIELDYAIQIDLLP